jgi:hypothetical protein
LPVVAYTPATHTGDTLANTASSYTFMYHAPTGLGFFSQTDFATTGGVGYWFDGAASGTVSTHVSPRAYSFSGMLGTGTDAHAQARLIVYPNPVRDWLYIRSGQEGQAWLLTDLAGKEVQAGTGTVLDCRSLPVGWYFLHVIGQNGAAPIKRKVCISR